MEFEGCANSNERSLCEELITSRISFVAYAPEKKLRLALTKPVSVSLNLTVLHSPCTISCTGEPNNCSIYKNEDFWANATSPHYIGNCTPSHNYCVTASIGDCCPLCTDSILMPDHRNYVHEERQKWNFEVIVIVLLLLTLVCVSSVVILKKHLKDRKSKRHKFQTALENSLSKRILSVNESLSRTQVVCFYLKEINPSFIDLVHSLKQFLREKGINVIDIYDEEDIINRSVAKWVQNVIKEENSKILLIDTAKTRLLWNGTIDSKQILNPLEQVFLFTKSCLPVTNIHSLFFVVRFQEMDTDAKTFIDLSDGRCYYYSVQKERLASDLNTKT